MLDHSGLPDWLPTPPPHWSVKPFRYAFRASDEQNGDIPIGEMLSVSGYPGIVPKIYEFEEQKRSDDELRDYRVVRPGQLAVNTMWLNYTGLGVSGPLPVEPYVWELYAKVPFSYCTQWDSRIIY